MPPAIGAFVTDNLITGIVTGFGEIQAGRRTIPAVIVRTANGTTELIPTEFVKVIVP